MIGAVVMIYINKVESTKNAEREEVWQYFVKKIPAIL